MKFDSNNLRIFDTYENGVITSPMGANAGNTFMQFAKVPKNYFGKGFKFSNSSDPFKHLVDPTTDIYYDAEFVNFELNYYSRFHYVMQKGSEKYLFIKGKDDYYAFSMELYDLILSAAVVIGEYASVGSKYIKIMFNCEGDERISLYHAIKKIPQEVKDILNYVTIAQKISKED